MTVLILLSYTVYDIYALWQESGQSMALFPCFEVCGCLLSLEGCFPSFSLL